MNYLLINSHPYAKSFNRQLSKDIQSILEKKHQVKVLDLVKDGFNPVMKKKDLAGFALGHYADPKVGYYQELIQEADVLIFSFPIWWNMMPAVLKGFCDKVLLKGFAYAYSKEGMMEGLLDKEAIVITTMETTKDNYKGVLKDPVRNSFLHGTLGLCGITTRKYFQLEQIGTIGNEERNKQYQKILRYMKKQ